MKSKHVLPIQIESFALLVKRLKRIAKKADIIELWLDSMRVKGDLAVIHSYFKVPMMAKSDSLDFLKKGVKAGMDYVDVPVELQTDAEFETLVKNKGALVVRSYHNFEETPSNGELLELLKTMESQKADYFKIATWIKTEADSDRLLELLQHPHYKGKLIITGMGPLSRRLRIQAPLQGSLFYYAPLTEAESSAPGQLTRAELEQEWKTL